MSWKDFCKSPTLLPVYFFTVPQTALPGHSRCKGYKSFLFCKNWEGKGRVVARLLLPGTCPHHIKVDEKAGICTTAYMIGGIAVTQPFSDTFLWCLPAVRDVTFCFLTTMFKGSREPVEGPTVVPLRVRKRVSYL